jgi:peptide-methionine (S)-S-oxide reductase
VITYETILEIFWLIHDPTTSNRQGPDIGSEYRSVIFYQSDDQLQRAEASRDAAQKLVDAPIVTEIIPLEHFYEAEPEHQNYFRNHPERAYCQVIINPKLTKLRSKYAKLLKEDA